MAARSVKILFCGPPYIGLAGPTGGVLRLMRIREQSLRSLGHEVCYHRFDEMVEPGDYDLAHVFMGNAATVDLAMGLSVCVPVVVSPIIDRTAPNLLLRGASVVERLPGVVTHLGRCRAMCQTAHAVCVRSEEELSRLRGGLGVTTTSRLVLCPVLPPDSTEEKSIDGIGETPFVLFIGEITNPRKNVARLIKAVREIDGVELLLAGSLREHRMGARIQTLVNQSDNVRLLGVIGEAEKRWALRRARVFALPSLMEGIGLAAVEAAHLGTTVVTTERGGPRDYLGSLAYYVRPKSIRSIRAGIRRALGHPLDASEQLSRTLDLTSSGEALVSCYRAAVQNFRNKRA